MTLAPDLVRAVVAELAWTGPHCREPNGHHYCGAHDACSCTCHQLGNDQIGWLYTQMAELIAELADTVGPLSPTEDAWWNVATLLAVWWCGTDHVRIQHALGRRPTVIWTTANHLRANDIWCADRSWRAEHIEDDDTGLAMVELACQALVAEGQANAHIDSSGRLVYHLNDHAE